MEEYKNYSNYDDEEQMAPANDKAIRGYRVVIILLTVILAALSVLYFNIHRQQKADYDLLAIDRDSIQNNLSALMTDFDSLQYSSDTISTALLMERQRADSLMQRLKQERSWSYSKIKQYQKEVGTLQSLMRNYLRQIDSLNTLNQKLITENVGYRREITTITQRAEMAEERAEELNNKVRVGAIIRARSITMQALNNRGKEVTRVKNAQRLYLDFALAANELAEPGNKAIYACVTSPEGYLIANNSASTFTFEGEQKVYSAMREVDYECADLPVGIYVDGSGFTPGTYRIELYVEGRLAGTAEVAMR